MNIEGHGLCSNAKSVSTLDRQRHDRDFVFIFCKLRGQPGMISVRPIKFMETIATYSERRMDGRRQFSLFPDEIVVVGYHFFGASYEAGIPLKSIEPTVSRIFSRSTFFLAG